MICCKCIHTLQELNKPLEINYLRLQLVDQFLFDLRRIYNLTNGLVYDKTQLVRAKSQSSQVMNLRLQISVLLH